LSEIVGVGLDTVELVRMRSALDRTPRLQTRAFTDGERAYCLAKGDPTERFAVRFAAKEAVLKVLGEGILRVPLRDIEVVKAPSGKPSLRLAGVAAERAADLGITSWQISLTHTATAASAVAIGLHDGSPAEDPAGEAAFWASLDRKRNGAAALLSDPAGRLLVVEPTYEPGWTLPGGAVDAGESPRQACEREILEEVGLRRRVGRLLAVEWRRSLPPRGESMLFVFDGGTISADEAAAIALPADELSAHAFVAADEAVARMGTRAKRRRVRVALAALAAGTVAWLDDGTVVDGPPGPG
jgi:phosphopantetheine--protein transferase-like protein